MRVLLRFLSFFSSRRRHTRCSREWSSDVCSSDLFSLLQFVAGSRAGAELVAGLIVIATMGYLAKNRATPLWSSLVLTGGVRSEEHTSELQSRLHLVCRLLLEKKKNTQLCVVWRAVSRHVL